MTLRRGEVLGLLGANGAGKTTTMQVLTGNLAPSAGSVAICGFDLADHPVQAKQHIGYLPEHPPIYRELTVDEYLKFAAKLHGLARLAIDRAIDDVKVRCGIGDCGKRLLGSLSKGYQQRVGIAQAIIHDPDVVVLDEPTVGLDPIQIREIRSLIRSLAEDCSVLLSTHILPEVESICDRVEILNRGRVVFSDSIAALQEFTHGLALKVVFRAAPTLSELTAIPGITRVEALSANSFRVDRKDDPDPTAEIVERAVREGWGLVEIGPIRERLEDVFVELTRSEC